MLLHYPRARRPMFKSPYVWIDGAHVCLELGGEAVEVDDRTAHKIIDKDGDIIKVYVPGAPLVADVVTVFDKLPVIEPVTAASKAKAEAEKLKKKPGPKPKPKYAEKDLRLEE